MSEARFRAAGVLGHALVGGLFATVRFRATGEESFLRFRRAGKPVIFVLWHGHLLPLTWRHRGTGVVALVSEHADGEYIARVLERLGYGTVRGSSTRGGTGGLKGLIRAVRAGHDLGVTVEIGAREFTSWARQAILTRSACFRSEISIVPTTTASAWV